MKVKATFREYENGGTKGFVDYSINGSIGIKGAALLEGEFGMFVNLPTVHVKNEYRDVISGVSNEFRDLLLEAALAARDSENHIASVGEYSELCYEPHVTALDDKTRKTKALASLTVRDHEGAEKSSFTVSNIRIMQGRENNLFVAMPSVKTDNPEFPYNNICYLTRNSRRKINERLLESAKQELGMEKPSLDEAVRSATAEMNSAAYRGGGARPYEAERVGAMR